jgi:cytochrome P450
VTVPADAYIYVLLGAANRDPTRFNDPDRFEMIRADAKAHLALDASIRLRLGALVARMEAVEFLAALALRVG